MVEDLRLQTDRFGGGGVCGGERCLNKNLFCLVSFLIIPFRRFALFNWVMRKSSAPVLQDVVGRTDTERGRARRTDWQNYVVNLNKEKSVQRQASVFVFFSTKDSLCKTTSFCALL